MIVDDEPDILASIKSIYDYLTKPIDFNQLMSSVKKCNMYLFA